MNANASGYPLINAYITVNRGAADNAAIIWNVATDKWQLDRATGTNYDIVDTAGGQSIGGTTTLNAASVTNGLHAGELEVSGNTKHLVWLATTMKSSRFARCLRLMLEVKTLQK